MPLRYFKTSWSSSSVLKRIPWESLAWNYIQCEHGPSFCQNAINITNLLFQLPCYKAWLTDLESVVWDSGSGASDTKNQAGTEWLWEVVAVMLQRQQCNSAESTPRQAVHPVYSKSPPHITCAMILTITLGCTTFQSGSPMVKWNWDFLYSLQILCFSQSDPDFRVWTRNPP